MKVFTERAAEKFLDKQGFDIVKTKFIKKESEIENALSEFDMPVVLKVSGKKIVHKSLVDGIKKDIKSFNDAIKAFKQLKKIKGAQGVLIQGQIKGKEFLLGLKKTDDFGYVVGFGKGGSRLQAESIEFRVCGVKGVEKLSNNKNIQKILFKLCKLADKYPKIKELDINPLILEKNKAVIVDSQIVFD